MTRRQRFREELVRHFGREPLEHADEVLRCRGTVCFAALAVHFGSTSPATLEARVDRRRPYETVNGERTWSNIYRCWRRDGKLPSEKTVGHVWERTAGAVNLRRWRDLLLWELLGPAPQISVSPEERKKQFPPQIGRIIFRDVDLSSYYLKPFMCGPEQTLAVRNLRSLDAFLALLYLARQAELIGDEPQHFLPAMCVFDLLPRVLYRYPQLRYRWRALFVCIERILSRRLRENDAKPPVAFAVERVEAGLTLLLAKPDAALDQVSDENWDWRR